MKITLISLITLFLMSGCAHIDKFINNAEPLSKKELNSKDSYAHINYYIYDLATVSIKSKLILPYFKRKKESEVCLESFNEIVHPHKSMHQQYKMAYTHLTILDFDVNTITNKITIKANLFIRNGKRTITKKIKSTSTFKEITPDNYYVQLKESFDNFFNDYTKVTSAFFEKE